MEIIRCHLSPIKDHQYDLQKYERDDQAFYLDCIHCHETETFWCDTEDELLSIFGINDEEE